MVRDFQSVIGHEAREQVLNAEGRLPSHLVACVGGGSNSLGLFHAFLQDPVALVGVEAGGRGLDSGLHAARFDSSEGRLGILHGSKTFVLSDADGQVLPTHSVAAGLDYPSVGPEHSYLRASGRARYTSVTDEQALEAFTLTCRSEGIIVALESAHAIAYALELAGQLDRSHMLLVNLSGRGDKDIFNIANALGVDLGSIFETQAHSVCLDRCEVWTARYERHLFAAVGETGSEVSADGAGADDGDLHPTIRVVSRCSSAG